MPLRQAAQEMRDMYANEIARAVHAGAAPTAFAISSWAKYDEASRSENPVSYFRAEPGSRTEQNAEAEPDATS